MKNKIYLNLQMVLVILAIIIIGGAILAASSLINKAVAQETPQLAVNEESEEILILEGTITAPIDIGDEFVDMPMSEATVYLYNEDYHLLDQSVTGEDGNYKLTLHPNENYNIVFEKQGYIARRVNLKTEKEFVSEKEALDVALNIASQFNKHANDFIDKDVQFAGNYLEEKLKYMDEVIFTIQVGRYNEPVSEDYFKELEDIDVKYHENALLYVSGKYKNLKEALNELNEVREKGYNDAFVTAYNKDKRVPAIKAAAAMAEE